ACCHGPGVCQANVTEAECLESEGAFLGVGTDCSGEPCGPPPTGACWRPEGSSNSLTQSECNAQGGIFTGGGSCSPNPCGPGACCNGTTCNIRTAYDCIAGGFGPFLGAGTSCSPNPCAPTAPCTSCPGD